MGYKKSREGNGIEFAGRNRITIKNKVEVSAKLMVFQILFIILGIYGMLFSFITGFQIEVDIKSVLVGIIITTSIFYALFRISYAGYFGFPAFVLIYLYAGHEFFDEIKNGLWNIENYMIDKINGYYNINLLNLVAESYNEKTVVTIFLLFLIPVLCFLTCIVILRNILCFIFIFISMTLVLSPFAVGYVPAALPFGAYMLCIICIVGMYTTRKEKHKLSERRIFKKEKELENRLLEQNFRYIIGFKVGILLGVILFFLFIITTLILMPVYPKQEEKIAALKQNIQKQVAEISFENTLHLIQTIPVFDVNIAQSDIRMGGLSQGLLEGGAGISYEHNTALQVEAFDLGKSIYLKGYTGSIYEDNSWGELDKEKKEAYKRTAKIWEGSNFRIGSQSSYFLSLINVLDKKVYKKVKFSSLQVKVDYINADKDFVYVPYNAFFESESALNLEKEEYIVAEQKEGSYTYNYFSLYSSPYDFEEEEEYKECLKVYDNMSEDGTAISYEEREALKKLQEYRIYEAAYRTYVYDTYLQVPENGLNQLKAEFEDKNYEYYKEKYGENALSRLVLDVKSRIQKNTTYSLNPGELPEGEDFIEYFLYTNKKGYCSHYASAAVMIFRIMGVPSRYVEGYLVKKDDIAQGTKTGQETIISRMEGNKKITSASLKSLEVEDTSAHAWAEIYVDGFGWVSVEATPSVTAEENSGEETNELNNSLINETTLFNEANSALNRKKSSLSDQTSQLENDSIKAKEDTLKEEKKDSVSSHLADEEIKDKGRYLKKAENIALWSLRGFSGIILILLLRFLFIVNKRKIMLSDFVDSKKRTLICFHEVNKILKYEHIGLDTDKTYREAATEAESALKSIEKGSFQRFMELSLKASFGNGSITKEEFKEVVVFYEKIMEELYKNKGFIEKLYLKFVKVFY